MSFTVKQVADSEQIGVSTLLDLIRDGELIAYDISRRVGGKPSWRITEEELAAFRERRSSVKPVKALKQRRRPITRTREEEAAAYFAK